MLRKLMEETDYFRKQDFFVACETPTQDPASCVLEEGRRRQRQIAFLHHVSCSLLFTGPFSVDSGLIWSSQNHFRRIGKTVFLVCSFDPSHPSRSLAAADDPESDMTQYQQLDEPDVNDIPQRLANEARRYPLHFAVGFSQRNVDLYSSAAGKPIDVFIKECYAANPACVREHSDTGLTPLHAAAMQKKVLAVETLLDLGAQQDLDDRMNIYGIAPYEATVRVMKMERKTEELTGKRWNGYADEAIQVLWILRRAAGEDVGTLEDFLAQRKWGCTCGECTEGWFSPRMRYRMKSTCPVLLSACALLRYSNNVFLSACCGPR